MPSTAIPQTQVKNAVITSSQKLSQKITISVESTLEWYSVADRATEVCRGCEHPVVYASAKMFVLSRCSGSRYFFPVSVAQQPQKSEAGQQTI